MRFLRCTGTGHCWDRRSASSALSACRTCTTRTSAPCIRFRHILMGTTGRRRLSVLVSRRECDANRAPLPSQRMRLILQRVRRRQRLTDRRHLLWARRRRQHHRDARPVHHAALAAPAPPVPTALHPNNQQRRMYWARLRRVARLLPSRRTHREWRALAMRTASSRDRTKSSQDRGQTYLSLQQTATHLRQCRPRHSGCDNRQPMRSVRCTMISWWRSCTITAIRARNSFCGVSVGTSRARVFHSARAASRTKARSGGRVAHFSSAQSK